MQIDIEKIINNALNDEFKKDLEQEIIQTVQKTIKEELKSNFGHYSTFSKVLKEKFEEHTKEININNYINVEQEYEKIFNSLVNKRFKNLFNYIDLEEIENEDNISEIMHECLEDHQDIYEGTEVNYNFYSEENRKIIEIDGEKYHGYATEFGVFFKINNKNYVVSHEIFSEFEKDGEDTLTLSWI